MEVNIYAFTYTGIFNMNIHSVSLNHKIHVINITIILMYLEKQECIRLEKEREEDKLIYSGYICTFKLCGFHYNFTFVKPSNASYKKV